MTRNTHVLGGLILLGLALAALATIGLSRPALAQPVDCRAVTAQQYQECDEDTVTVVPPRPEPPRPDPTRPAPPDPEPPDPGTAGIFEFEDPDVEVVSPETGVVIAGQPSPASASVSASAPASSSASPGAAAEVSQAAALPETGGVAPALPLLTAALLLGTGVLAGRWILRRG